MKKIVYIGALPSGHVEHGGKRYPFKRGEAVEVPDEVEAIKSKQEPNDWREEFQAKAASQKDK
jgi:hypothetical protein